MIFLVPLWLTKVEQGYYYTFGSLLALSVFFELGVNQVVTQVVAHEFAHLELRSDGTIAGPRYHISRLSSVVRLLTRWYAVAAFLFFVGVGTAGSIFFARHESLTRGQWSITWWMMALFTAGNLFFSPRLAVIEGCGQVGQVARLRLVQSFFGYTVMWTGLAAGAGLWIVPAVPGIAMLFTAAYLSRAKSPLSAVKQVESSNSSEAIRWRTEILPFQWRIAVSWISGYFIFQLFTPLLFRHQGAVAAGQLGIAISMYNAIGALGLSWVSAKLPVFVAHIARGERNALDASFAHVVKRSIAFTMLMSLVVLGCVAALRAWVPAWAERIAPVPVLSCLVVATVANALTSVLALYMRAHKREPMLPQSITVAILVGTVCGLTSSRGAFEMVLGYALILVFVALPWATLLFRSFRRLPA